MKNINNNNNNYYYHYDNDDSCVKLMWLLYRLRGDDANIVNLIQVGVVRRRSGRGWWW